MAATDRTLLITFDTLITKRFSNQSTASTPPVVTNNGLSIVTHEVFDGDGAGQLDGVDDYLSVSSDSRFAFNAAGALRAWRIKFFCNEDGSYGVIGRRADVDNRWHVLINTSANTLTFFARVGGSTKHNVTHNLPLSFNLAQWHVLEMVHDEEDTRFYLDGYYVGSSNDAGATSVTFTAAVEIGRVNTSATGTPSYTYLKAIIDTVEHIHTLTALPNTEYAFVNATTAYPSFANTLTRLWTGSTEKLHSFASDLVQAPAILGNSFPQNIPDFEAVNNAVYIAGIDPMKKVLQDGTVANVGMANPAAPTTALGSATGLTGTYDYIVTWEDAYGNESGPSPISTARTPANQKIDVSQPASPPTEAAYWNIYRRKTSANQAQHYFVTRLAIGTATYNDNVADSAVSLLRIPPKQSIGAPPAANFVADHTGRMYYLFVKVGSDTYPTRVYYSQVNAHEQVGSNDWFYVGKDDSEYITGGWQYSSNLIIFKERSLYKTIGDPIDPGFDIDTISKSIGCVAHQTIKELEGRLVWLADEGFYAYDGDEPVCISDLIEPLFSDMPKARRPYATSAVDIDLGLYLTAISLKSETENDFILCFHYRDSFKDGVSRWSLWRVKASTMFDGAIGANRQPRSLFGTYDSKLGYFELGGLDFFAGISWRWKGVGINPVNPGSRMRAHYLTATLEKAGFRNALVRLGADNGDTEQLTQHEIDNSGNKKQRIATRAEYIFPVFEGIDIRERLRLLGLQIDPHKVSKR